MEDIQLDVVMTPRLSNGQRLRKSLLDAILRVYSAARGWAQIVEAARRRRATMSVSPARDTAITRKPARCSPRLDGQPAEAWLGDRARGRRVIRCGRLGDDPCPRPKIASEVDELEDERHDEYDDHDRGGEG